MTREALEVLLLLHPSSIRSFSRNSSWTYVGMFATREYWVCNQYPVWVDALSFGGYSRRVSSSDPYYREACTRFKLLSER